MLYLTSPEHSDWEHFVAGDKANVSEALQRSWTRSVGLSEASSETFLDTVKTKERQDTSQRVWRHVEPVLERLSAQLTHGGFVGVWADPEGVILHRRGGGSFLSTAQKVELIEGANWNESARGTNAIGTAIAENCEVAVLGHAHLQQLNHELVCYAAPVCSPTGELVGILDVTSNLDAAQDMAFAAVVAARSAVELALKLSTYDDALRGGLEGLRQVLEACPSPAFLLERDGNLRAVNARARSKFGLDRRRPLDRWSWDTLMQFRDSNAVIEIADADGIVRPWHAAVECVGPSHDPVAALLFLEPFIPQRRVSAQPELPKTPNALDRLYGDDALLNASKQKVERLAPTDLPVLILAETGTGKETIAHAIHEMSHRASGPFVPINCGALSQDLLESELFGYAPGAFTGARAQGAEGKVAAADGGTLFLDEVAEMSPTAQAMLLRVLEDGSYYRVGDATPRQANVRVVAATCRDIEAMLREGKIRPDLYFRLKGARVSLPALRERDDLALLAAALLRDIAARYNASTPSMSMSFANALRAYRWPGNVRELKNTLHVAWVLSDGAEYLDESHLPDDVREASTHARAGVPTLIAAEAEALEEALDKSGGNLSKTARILGVARSTLYRMMERHGLRP